MRLVRRSARLVLIGLALLVGAIAPAGCDCFDEELWPWSDGGYQPPRDLIIPGDPVSSGSCGCQPNCVESCTMQPRCQHDCPVKCKDCRFDCTQTDRCEVMCDIDSVCVANSRSTGTTSLTCKSGASCELNCTNLSTCFMNCTSTSACLVRCSGTGTCKLDGCAPLMCATGVMVCNRPCP